MISFYFPSRLKIFFLIGKVPEKGHRTAPQQRAAVAARKWFCEGLLLYSTITPETVWSDALCSGPRLRRSLRWLIVGAVSAV